MRWQIPGRPRLATRLWRFGVLGVAAVAVAVAVGAGGCRRDSDVTEGEPPPAPKRVRCAAITEEMATDAIELRGTVAPPAGRDALIAPQVAGRVLTVRVREGEAVRVGQELARVDDGTLVDQAHQADAVVARAHAETELAHTTEARVRRVFERGIAARQEVDDAVARSPARAPPRRRRRPPPRSRVDSSGGRRCAARSQAWC